MVRIPGFHCCGLGSVPGWGTEILQAVQCGQKKKKKKKVFKCMLFVYDKQKNDYLACP